LGGVPQTPSVSYSVAGNTVTFTAPPLAGTTFYALSSVVL
jgi:acyl dehydratase